MSEADALTAAARAERAAGHPREALAAAERAHALDADHLEAAYLTGALRTQFGDQQGGEAALRRALALDPQAAHAAHGLALNLLGQGRYDEAWAYYPARRAVPQLQPRLGIPSGIAAPRWDGRTPLAGRRIAIHPEQGLGDQIQFARFLPALLAAGAAVTLHATPSLVRLFAQSFPQVQVVSAEAPGAVPAPDCWATLADLPQLLGATPATLPQPPYLATPVTWADPPAGLKVGLMMQGNPALANDRRRSVSEALANAIRARLPGRVLNLDPKASGARDFADTAAIVQACAFVVSIDTSVAHLAGALGRDCLLLVPGFGTDWRWQRDRADSPWYPSHRLYRSTTEGDWDGAVAALLADAHALAAATA